VFPWFRLLGAGMSLIGQARVDVLTTTTVRMRVWPNDLDANRHVNNGRYLALADIGRIHWFLHTGALAIARKHQAFPVIGDAIAKFRRDLRLFQAFELQTRLVGWDQKWAFMEHRFLRAGRVLGVVAVRGLFKGPDGLLEPREIAASLSSSPVSPALPDWVVRFDDAADLLSESLREEERAAGIR
jgi:acyl-CoA thioesterase FadM